MRIELFIICLMSFFLVACDFGKEDTDQIVEDIKKNTPSNIEALPKLKEYIPGKYTASNLNDPFDSFNNFNISKPNINLPVTKIQTKRPDYDRSREYLENYALDTLTMVGVLKNKDAIWGLIVDRSGILHKVKQGNYLGQNSGKIKTINEEDIEVEETISDEQGGWINRDTNIKLKDHKHN